MLKRGGFLKATDRDALARFPNHVDTDDLARCFTLTPHDFAEVIDRRYGDGALLAAGVQNWCSALVGIRARRSLGGSRRGARIRCGWVVPSIRWSCDTGQSGVRAVSWVGVVGPPPGPRGM